MNEEKTRICKAPEGEFDFLGYTFGRMYSAKTGQARIGYRPSKKSIQRAVEKVHALTERSCTWQETTTLVGKVNRTLRGWANYCKNDPGGHPSIPLHPSTHGKIDRVRVVRPLAHRAQGLGLDELHAERTSRPLRANSSQSGLENYSVFNT